MFHVLIDTSVWLDLAENQRQTPLIDVVAELVKEKQITQDEWVKAGSNNSTHIVDSVWDGARRAAADTLKRLGKAKCGPHDDFEWGMINGKLSAIRWMLGDDWDMLDT